MIKKFFVVCPLGLEGVLQKEIQSIFPFFISKSGFSEVSTPRLISTEKGGVEIECEISLGFQINYFSKVASRVLMRIHKFDAQEFFQLESQFKKLKLSEFGIPIRELNIEASKSKINNEKKIQEIFLRYHKIEPQSDPGLDLYIRNFRDEFTISVDTSGSHLHYRGWAKKVGLASIRENLAAACLHVLLKDISANEMDQLSIWDPMMGSGTFLTEVSVLNLPNTLRKYAFQNFKNCPIHIKNLSIQSLIDLQKSHIRLIGSDINLEQIEAANLNFKNLGLEVQSSQADFFKFNLDVDPQKLIIVSNLPYGERVRGQRGLYQEVVARTSEMGPLLAGFIFPEGELERLKLRPIRRLRFKNGGIPVEFAVFKFKGSL